MPRNVDTLNQAQLVSNQVSIAFLLQITFKSQTVYVSSTPFNLAWNGQTWLGVGDLASLSTVNEGTDIQAYGTSVTLSGIDPNLLKESLTDIQLGATANLYLAFLDPNNNIIGTPTCMFGGWVDQPSITPGVDSITISLALESSMINLQRGQMRRLTNADQQIDFPTDISMIWVPQLNFLALKWGTS
ncbi:hypothetical protein HNQ77_002665 [Silvibacterium bohemicum]|uniref:Uncharacterized protein n=1 Tax=Silvibacterium bohemicum TaxID=1577686 RepID=A0A841JYA1_9BACT|nr:hypothetical protein [Silvibacterium bohemicum]MBB6144709.1 hypothetical protein [Silvibacterium bohemicum]